MKNLLSPTLVVIAFFLLLGCGSQGKLRQPAAASDPLAALQAEIDQILADSVLLRTRTGLKVVSLQSGETLYARDSRYLYNPASNMKLLTTAAALKRLGPDFRYQTTLWADSAAVQDSIISGDIYLKGSGDPDLLRDGLRRLTGQLKALGIRRIAGDLRCDESYMDDLYWGSGWMWDDVSGWYWAPISALTVEDNCVTVTVTPGEAAGDPLEVSIDPPTAYMQIDNRGRTAAPTDSASLKA
ncbi:MAG: D-alanyl-D-alanine carboxypeptidase/D-alanyl-D-alanine-endopeptidase, partial [Calditrichaeota bacterium]|nr:D-alanyl-D-alanine carboxypeptidase/D-alanyl-D-alanine-endopeptidase [Calditrichota bacterium]